MPGRTHPFCGSRPPARVAPVDERAARAALRGQIAKLERELGQATGASCARATPSPPRVARACADRGSSPLGELERVRDAQAARLADLRGEIAARAAREAEKRMLLEKMLLEPGRYRFVSITQAELGERGCGALPRPPAPRPDRHARGLVAGQGLLRLSVSRAAPQRAARP